jgi:hypothetical protein
MTSLAIHRIKRHRDSFKAVNARMAIADNVTLQAMSIGSERERWYVQFRQVNGMKRSKVRKILPFWDTDVGMALFYKK